MVIHLATGEDTTIDYREPPGGDQCQELSRRGPATPIRRSRATSALAIGVPGTVAGFDAGREEYSSGHAGSRICSRPPSPWRATV